MSAARPRTVLVGWLAASAVLVVLAWRASMQTSGLSPTEAVADAAVGAAFLVSSALSVGPVRQRTLVASVGLAWLLASVAPVTGLHRWALLLMLLAFPRGRPGFAGALVAVLALPMAGGLLGLAGDAAAFAVVALVCIPRSVGRPVRASSWYPTVAAAGMALVLMAAWAWNRSTAGSPGTVLMAYFAVLAAIAAGHAPASRGVANAVRDDVARLAAAPAPDDGRDGLTRVAPLLARAIGDPELELHRIDPGERPIPPPHDGLVVLGDAGQPVAVARSRALRDPRTAQSVAGVLRLIAAADRSQAALTGQLTELEAARDRLVAADDRQRDAVASRLGEDVLPELGRAERRIDAFCGAMTAAPDQAVQVAREAISAAAADLLDLVRGVPPTTLRTGDLCDALTSIARSSPIPVHVFAPTATGLDPDVARAAYYVCSEGLANAIKHSGARRVDIVVSRDQGLLIALVRDDGRGGARPDGPGLSGIADRLTTLGGSLAVASPSGGGTSIRARIPLAAVGHQPPDRGSDDSGEPPDRTPDMRMHPTGIAGVDTRQDLVGGATPAVAEEASHRAAAVVMTAVLLGGTAGALLSVTLARSQRGIPTPLLHPSLLGLLVLTSAALSFCVGWAWWDRRTRVRDGLLLVGSGALLAFWSVAPWLPPAWSAVVLAAPPLLVPGAWVISAAWDAPSGGRREGGTILGLALAAALVHAIGYDPFTDPGCLLTCQDLTPLAGPVLDSRSTVALSSGLALSAAAVAGAALVSGRHGGAAPPWVRRTAVLSIALTAGAAASHTLMWSSPRPALTYTLVLLSALLVTSGLLVTSMQVRAQRRRVRDLVDELGAIERATTEDRQHAQFRRPDGSGWIDAQGHDVPSEPSPGTADVDLIPVGPAVRLPAQGRVPAWSAPRLGPGDLLALANARTAALTLASQRQVRTTQARIVQRSDMERRRIERDLHDGAQQRLVGAKMHLRIASATAPASAQQHLDEADQHLQRAVEALREICHGVYPRLLETEGLASALTELGEASRARLRLRQPPGLPVTQEVALVVYGLVETMVRSVRDDRGGVEVTITEASGVVRLDASATHQDWALVDARLTDLVDRAGALGGRARVTRSDASLRVDVELPCVW